ncbi:MAG: hypothetical protein JJ896_15205 [Rhodothermales bacterium]|nr:hypothetical protein [Rhodothermales bacterium]MBO6781001.1 hypothetical protein [Rhodothermales bacterium]
MKTLLPTLLAAVLTGCASTATSPQPLVMGPRAAFHILVLGPDTTSALAIPDVLIESTPRYILGRTDSLGVYRVLEDPPNEALQSYEIRATAETVGAETGVFLVDMARNQIPLDTMVIRLNWHAEFRPGLDTTASGMGTILRRGVRPVNNE